MAIELTQPITQPAKTFDSVWITQTEIRCPSPAVKAAAIAIAVPFNTVTKELGTTPIPIIVPDLFVAAAKDTRLAAWLAEGIEIFAVIGKAQGKL